MENRIKQLQKEQIEIDRKLDMLERLKKKQLNCIDDQPAKDEKSMEQINQYKEQYRELNY